MQLGLGAGAITRFCSKRLKMRITAVELNPRVIDACRHLVSPAAPSSATFDVLEMDAQRFVADPARHATADVLCVDLYDHEAASPVLDSAEFYRRCFDVLADGGVMTRQPVRPRRQLRGQHRAASPPRSAPTPCLTVQPTQRGQHRSCWR